MKVTFQAKYFAANFPTYSDLLNSYRLGGGHIPSLYAFLKAKSQIKKIRLTDGEKNKCL